MRDNPDRENNTVRTRGQAKRAPVRVRLAENDGIKLLFAGNSITLHEPSPEIGWRGNWGMAASCEEKDYVHRVVAGLTGQGVAVSYAVVNCGDWETAFYDDTIKFRYERARVFDADILVLRLGENISPAALLSEGFKLAAGNLISYLAPHARVYVTGLFWASAEVDGILRRLAAENGYTFIELGDLGEEERCKAVGKFCHAGVALHPGDEGMRCIAERILEKLL